MAYNNLKQWEKRMNDVMSRRSHLLQTRYNDLSQEEQETNKLLTQYFDKIK